MIAPNIGATQWGYALAPVVAAAEGEEDEVQTRFEQAADVLEGLRCPTYTGNIIAWLGWSHAEQGEGPVRAAFNSLNTTLVVPRSSDYNAAHVQDYVNYTSGTLALIQTLKDPRHVGILQQLMLDDAHGGSSQKVWAAVKDDASWGTRSLPDDLAAYDRLVRANMVFWGLFTVAGAK